GRRVGVPARGVPPARARPRPDPAVSQWGRPEAGAAARPLPPEGPGRHGADGGRAQVGRLRGGRGGLGLLREGRLLRLRARALRHLGDARRPTARARGRGGRRRDRDRGAGHLLPPADRAPGRPSRQAPGPGAPRSPRRLSRAPTGAPRSMDNLTLKLVVTPALIGTATLVGRRWGQAVGGWLVGLPLTTGPVAFFIALDHGERFAASAALGSLGGAAAEAAFALAYGRLATRSRWPLALLAGSAAFAAGAVVLERLTLGPWALVLVVVGALVVGIRLLP